MIIAVVAVLGVAAYAVLTKPDQRSSGEKLGDAVSKLDEGVDDAARELEDRTPVERFQDDIDDARDGSPQ
jgi:hypothetical protein